MLIAKLFLLWVAAAPLIGMLFCSRIGSANRRAARSAAAVEQATSFLLPPVETTFTAEDERLFAELLAEHWPNP